MINIVRKNLKYNLFFVLYKGVKLVRERSVINQATQSCFTKIASFDKSYYFCQAQVFNFKLGKTWSVSISFHMVVFRRRNYFIVCWVCRWCHNYGEYHYIEDGKSYLTILHAVMENWPPYLLVTSSSLPPPLLLSISFSPRQLIISFPSLPHLLLITSSSCHSLLLLIFL